MEGDLSLSLYSVWILPLLPAVLGGCVLGKTVSIGQVSTRSPLILASFHVLPLDAVCGAVVAPAFVFVSGVNWRLAFLF